MGAERYYNPPLPLEENYKLNQRYSLLCPSIEIYEKTLFHKGEIQITSGDLCKPYGKFRFRCF